MPTMLTIERCYVILGVQPGAAPDEVKRAYRDLVREWHPDKLQHDSRKQKMAEERLKEINIAYDRLQSYTETGGATSERARRSAPNAQSRRPTGYSSTQARRAYSGVGEEDEAQGESAYHRSVALNVEGMAHFQGGRLREAV